MSLINLILRSLEVSVLFFYKALWSILFGVLVTAAIDVFVDKERLARLLGGRDVGSVELAAGLGAVSSACTFGAVTIAQALFRKGASAESTFAFALASTNIVFELAVLIWVLLGPSVLAAELLSGVLLVVIMYLIVRPTLPVRLFDMARQRLQAHSTAGEALLSRPPVDWRTGLSTLDAWQHIAERYFKTLGRIYKSVTYGFLVSGFIVVLVPTWFWARLFLTPSHPLGIVEDAAMGVLVGMLSFIGSIGIVPFAAALFIKGVSFAGVVGVIVADLITVPVLNLWREFFGLRAAAYILAVFYTAMVAGTVIITYLFQVAGWIPKHAPLTHLPPPSLRPDYTLFLNILLLSITAFLWFAMNRPQRT